MAVLASTPGEVYTDLGANHHMWTYADYYDDNMVAARTRTASFTWFGGFVGTASTAVYNANGLPIGYTEPLSYGVNGTAFGNSDRTEFWKLPLQKTGVPGPPAWIEVKHGWEFVVKDWVIGLVKAAAAVIGIA